MSTEQQDFERQSEYEMVKVVAVDGESVTVQPLGAEEVAALRAVEAVAGAGAAAKVKPAAAAATVGAGGAKPPPSWAKWERELEVLGSMGFERNDGLVKLLERSEGSLNIVISHLLEPGNGRFAHLAQ